jgi:hypothetical protein
MKKSSFLLIVLFFLFLISAAGGVFYIYVSFYQTPEPEKINEPLSDAILRNYTNLKIFYPVGEGTEIFEKKVSSDLTRLEMADLLITTYLKISRQLDTGVIPEGASVNNIYISRDNIVYIDFSKAFKKNFRGDVIDEYMLLKTILDTIMGNVEDISDVVILIDGRQQETLGGHFFLNRPLKTILTQ